MSQMQGRQDNGPEFPGGNAVSCPIPPGGNPPACFVCFTVQRGQLKSNACYDKCLPAGYPAGRHCHDMGRR